MASLNSNTRTTATEVQEIFDTDLTTEQLNAHINAAAAIVDDVDAASDVSDQRLALIEKNVAAHFASSQDPRTSSEAIGDAQFDYQGPDETTQYWETATALDPTGRLAGDSVQVGIDVAETR